MRSQDGRVESREATFPLVPWLGIHAAGVLFLSEVGETGNSLKFNIRQSQNLRDSKIRVH